MSNAHDLSQFDPDNIALDLLETYDAELEVVGGTLFVTDSKGVTRDLGLFNVPSGLYIVSADIVSNGDDPETWDLTFVLSDTTTRRYGPIATQETIAPVFSGTGILTGVTGNVLQFEPVQINSPFKVSEVSQIGIEIQKLKPSKYSCFQQFDAASNGGAYVTTTYTKRPLNTVIANNLNLSMVNSVITFPPGLYYITAYAGMYRCGIGSLTLFDVAAGAIINTTRLHANCNDSAGCTVLHILGGVYEVTAPTDIYLASRSGGGTPSPGVTGMGVGVEITHDYQKNVFAQIEIWRLD